MKTYKAKVVQFLRPNRERREVTTDLPEATEADYESMTKHGCRFEAEELRTGQILVTISDPAKKDDLDISITENGPAMQRGMITMLGRHLWL